MAEPLEQFTQIIAGMRAQTTATHQNSAALADLLAVLSKPGSDAEKIDRSDRLAQALADALKTAQAPQVTVEPAQVTVSVQPANVVLEKDTSGQKWRIEIERAGRSVTAPISALIVTRL